MRAVPKSSLKDTAPDNIDAARAVPVSSLKDPAPGDIDAARAVPVSSLKDPASDKERCQQWLIIIIGKS